MIQVRFANDKDSQYFDLSNSAGYTVINIDGIDDVDRTVVSDRVSSHYGSMYRGWKVNDREINIEIVIRGNIETNRLALIAYFRHADNYRLFLRTETGEKYIDCYVSKVDYALFVRTQTVTVTLNCPFPYFTSVSPSADYTINNAVRQFASGITLPFGKAADVNCQGINMAWLFGTPELDIDNVETDDNVGLVVICTCRGQLMLTNDTNGQWIKFDTANGDKLMFDTRNGNRSAWLLTSYAYSNATELMLPGSSWIQLQAGNNHLRFTTSIGSEFQACLCWSGLKVGV